MTVFKWLLVGGMVLSVSACGGNLYASKKSCEREQAGDQGSGIGGMAGMGVGKNAGTVAAMAGGTVAGKYAGQALYDYANANQPDDNRKYKDTWNGKCVLAE